MASYPGKFLPTNPRQLMDLRKPPSVSVFGGQIVPDERPLFDLGELPPAHPDYGKEPWAFRQLLWHPTNGEEVVALTQSDVNSFHNRGYVDFPPNGAAINPVQAARDELAGLSPDDRARVLAAVHKQRLESVQARLAKLSDAELADIAAPAQGRKSA